MTDDLIKRARSGETLALARLISIVENGSDGSAEILRTLYPDTGKARIIGLTGPPGVGKSTLTDRLTTSYREAGLRVAVICVDPTSPFSGGAILGDRIRMVRHFNDPDVFIRSMATRGNIGGLASSSADVADVLDAVGLDVILMETIGVGQDSVDIARLVDCCLLVLTPGLGDDVQTMKGGIMEIGDIYVINKADLDGADRVEMALTAALMLGGLSDERPVIKTIAKESNGLADLVESIASTNDRLGDKKVDERQTGRARARVQAIVRSRLMHRIERQVATDDSWAATSRRVADREVAPHQAADEILSKAGLDV